MLTKEKVADIFKSIVRIFPGMPSYQKREGLRAQDKVIRTQLASRLTEQVERVGEITAELTNRAILIIFGTHMPWGKAFPCIPKYYPSDIDLDFRPLPPGELHCFLATLVFIVI